MIDEAVLVVADDAGTSAWVETVLQGQARFEQVTTQDLARVIRLLEATGARVALVEVTDGNHHQAIAAMTALATARPWVTIVALCRMADQDTLLRCMRAGARDCVVVGGDGQELRDRLRQHQLLRTANWREQLQSRLQNITLVTSVSPRVDTAFFAQNLAVAMATGGKGQRVLAVDLYAASNHVFHLETQNHFDLSQLLTSPDTLDENLIETALEAYRPNLRVLAGGADQEFLGDRAVDLFIALTRLMGMFDHIILDVGCQRQRSWVQSIGVHVSNLIVVAHQDVSELRQVREEIANWRSYLSTQCEIQVVLDGYEPSVPPNADEIAENVEAPVTARLPMEWKGRLEAMNMGVPFSESMPKNAYNRAMAALAGRLTGHGTEQGKVRKLFG